MNDACKSEPTTREYAECELTIPESDADSLTHDKQEEESADSEPEGYALELADIAQTRTDQGSGDGQVQSEPTDVTQTQAPLTTDPRLAKLERSAGSKRKTYNLATKRRAIDLLCSGKRRRCDVARELNVSGTTLSTWMKQREALIGYAGAMDRKSMHQPKHPSLDAMLLRWIEDMHSNSSVRLSGALLQEKAREMAHTAGMDNFRASSGWLSKFTARHNLRQYKQVGKVKVGSAESLDSSHDNVLTKVLESYAHDNIYSVEEFALFYRLLPGETITDSLCSAGQQAEERLTVLLSASMTGDKLPLLVVGKEAKPPCLSGVRTMPCQYVSDPKAWLTRELFLNWLITVDSRLERKVALLVDSWVGSHDNIQQWLSNIEVFVLPSSEPSLSLKHDIVSNLKLLYRSLMLKRVLPRLDAGQQAQLTVLDALVLLRESWQTITADSISACFPSNAIATSPALTLTTPCAPASQESSAPKELDITLATEFAQIDDEVCTHSQHPVDLFTESVEDTSLLADVQVTGSEPSMNLTTLEMEEMFHKLERHLLSMAGAEQALANLHTFKETEFKLRMANQKSGD